MTDRAKVIKGLENAKNVIENWIPMFEQYNSPAVIDEAIALLKEQEPVEPTREVNENGQILSCGNCGTWLIVQKQKYCHECGRAVKWE